MIQKLRELMKANPFQAFLIALADGRGFTIASPDMVWLAAGGRGGLHIFVPEEDIIVTVNPMLISSVETGSANFPISQDE